MDIFVFRPKAISHSLLLYAAPEQAFSPTHAHPFFLVSKLHQKHRRLISWYFMLVRNWRASTPIEYPWAFCLLARMGKIPFLHAPCVPLQYTRSVPLLVISQELQGHRNETCAVPALFPQVRVSSALPIAQGRLVARPCKHQRWVGARAALCRATPKEAGRIERNLGTKQTRR